ncbi:MAG: metalloprotease family protein [Promethearchaeota archaeon]
MIFDIYAFGEICFWVIPLVIFFSIIISAFLGSLSANSSYGMQITVAFSYIFCIGIIVHEAAHRLMCAVFGVKVKETKYFYVDRKKIDGVEYKTPMGYVKFKDIDSVIASLLLGIAPLIVNGLLVALIFYYGPVLVETVYYGICIYLGISLAIGSCPSKEDLTLWYKVIKKNPGRGLLEFTILFIFGGVIYALIVIWQVELWITLIVIISFFIIFILQGRAKSSVPRSKYLTKL